MSLRTCLGARRPLLSEEPEAARLLELPTFFVYPDVLDALLDPSRSFLGRRLDATFAVSDGPDGLRRGLDRARRRRGSPRSGTAASCSSSPTPASPPTGRRSRRCSPSAPSTTASSPNGSARTARSSSTPATRTTPTPSPACSATAPTRSAPESRCGPSRPWPTTTASASSSRPPPSPATRPRSRTACSRSCRRWASRPSTGTAARRSSRRSGSAPRSRERCLAHTTSTTGGLGFAALGADVLERHTRAFAERPTLDQPGYIRFRKRGGEYHANNPDPVIKELHASLGLVVEDPDDDGEAPRAEGPPSGVVTTGASRTCRPRRSRSKAASSSSTPR